MGQLNSYGEQVASYVRETADGVHWLGGCLKRTKGGEEVHSVQSTFLVVGAERTLLVDTGHPVHWNLVEDGLDEVLGDRELDYVFPTHTEYPHAGNLKRLLRKYPFAQVVGNVQDYHLYYPDLFASGYFQQLALGDEIDLGDRRFVVVDAVLRDLPNTFWGYDTASRTMFVADGFAYAHFHGRGQCRATSSEYDPSPKHEHAMIATETALWWPKYVDLDRYWPRLEALFERFDIALVAPTHGGVIDNPDVMVPHLKAVLADMRRKGREELASIS